MTHYFAISGERDSGKTTVLGQIALALNKSGFSVGGFLQRAVYENECRTGYELFFLESGDVIPFARKKSAPSKGGIGYEFHPLAWGFAESHLRLASAEVLIVDELGRIEAQGGGHMPALKAAIHSRQAKVFIFSIRKDCLRPILAELDVSMVVFGVAEKEVLTKAVLESLNPDLS